MATVNVNRETTDQFYRYKMPKLLAKVEGKGNGIKTVIVNMPEVAKALSRPPTYTTKYFGCELGAQTQFDFKNDRYIVNGSHETSKLQDLLDGFIKKFVLCPECNNPETNLNVRAKAGTISQRCIACGHSGNIDMRHKLTTFILKNPPDQDPSTGATPGKKDRKSNKARARERENRERDASPEETHNGDADIECPPKTEEDDNTTWGEDISKEAIQQRMEELTGAAKKMALNEDVEKSQHDRLQIFYDYVQERKDSVVANIKDIVAEAERLEVTEKAPLVLCEVLLNENILTQLKTYKLLFLRFTHDNTKSQKYLLGGFEMLIGNLHKEALLPKVAHILKLSYDLDIIDEEVLLKWGERVSKKYVSKDVATEIHEKAKPFLKWLKEAEEESDEESEDEDEVQIVYSTTEKIGTHTVKPAAASTADQGDEDNDDLDIDDI